MKKRQQSSHQKELDALLKKIKQQDYTEKAVEHSKKFSDQNEAEQPLDKGKRPPAYPLSDYTILKKHHKFLRQEQQEEKPNYRPNNHQYGELLAKKYYSKLYKQYAIVDLEQYEIGRIGCRWRSEKEVLVSKGQKICSNKKCDKLSKQTYEFNFAYTEDGEKKNALVKVRLCELCAPKLNYKKNYVKIEEP